MDARKRTAFSIWLGLLVLSGCGHPDGLNLAPVRGRVLLDGEPAVGGFVVFEPDANQSNAGPAAMAKILPDGTYVLTTKHYADGATIGPNRVGIAVFDPDKPLREQDEAKDVTTTKGEVVREVKAARKDGPVFRDMGNTYRLLSPEELRSPEKSGVAVEVTRGSNTFDFVIQPDGSVLVTR